MKALSKIEINLDQIQLGLQLIIEARTSETLFDAGKENNLSYEAQYQLVEGFFYDYELNSKSFWLADVGNSIVQPHQRAKNLGTIAPNIYVGTLSIPVIQAETSKECGVVELEVQSIKAGYRDDYRDMLGFITEKCIDLLQRANSPVSQYFEPNYSRDSRTLYQRFSFIKSVIGTEAFSEAVHRVVSFPVTEWTEIEEERDIRNVRRLSASEVRQIRRNSVRSEVPSSHPLHQLGIHTLPNRIESSRKVDSVDTPENRFIKHALETFLNFCTDIQDAATRVGHVRMQEEADSLIQILEGHLQHSVFISVSDPHTLRLNSPVLQRKEGYREILRIWLMYDLATKLVWSGGEDVYKAGKKDIATLYEYWLFFQLLDLFQSLFHINAKDVSELIQETNDGLNLEIKQGKFTALAGVYETLSRKINIRFSYNRTFNGSRNYPDAGSWTTSLRPDYTLSLWPFGITEDEAETQELIVHIHFDAKYKISNLNEFLSRNINQDLDVEKVDNRKGLFKNADLLKMHAYKDAIRRTGGAYILYPGDVVLNQKGFHEIIPGLGAFPVKPDKNGNGIAELRQFVSEVIEHFVNRTSQREKIALRTFDIYKEPPYPNSSISEAYPESYNNNRDLIPDETFVLVAFFKSDAHYSWIRNTRLYNLRMGADRGALVLNKELVCAKYLLLHTYGDADSSRLWRIVSKGPKVFAKSDLLAIGYPNPSKENYLVIEIEQVEDFELQNHRWDFKRLNNFTKESETGVPFTTSLVDLVKNKVD